MITVEDCVDVRVSESFGLSCRNVVPESSSENDIFIRQMASEAGPILVLVARSEAEK